MPFSDLYLHYKSQLSECSTMTDFDHIIESSFNDYMKNRLTDTEYGKIYFACVAKQNDIYF